MLKNFSKIILLSVVLTLFFTVLRASPLKTFNTNPEQIHLSYGGKILRFRQFKKINF